MGTSPAVADHSPMRVTLDELWQRVRLQFSGSSRPRPITPRGSARSSSTSCATPIASTRASSRCSVHVPRTVLERRLAPESRWRNPHVAVYWRLLLICDHGFSVEPRRGDARRARSAAGDVVGGIEAWLAAGLPIARPTLRHAPPALAGMEAPEPLALPAGGPIGPLGDHSLDRAPGRSHTRGDDRRRRPVGLVERRLLGSSSSSWPTCVARAPRPPRP